MNMMYNLDLYKTYDTLSNQIYYTEEDIIKLLNNNNISYKPSLIPIIEQSVKRSLDIISKQVDNILTITEKHSPKNKYDLKDISKEVRKRFRNGFNFDGKEYILYDAPYVKYNKRTKEVSVRITDPIVKDRVIAKFINDENIKENLTKTIYEIYNTTLLKDIYDGFMMKLTN